MRKRIDWQWEVLDVFTKRAKVIGGWIVQYGSHTNKGSVSESMVFVPDRDHEWEIMPPIVDMQVQRSTIAKDFISPKD